jgi:CRISPR-associated endonuclease/helicase Cas3
VSLARTEFEDFFAAVRGGARPFAWQQRLLEHLSDGGVWPEAIDAPTGTGKTAVVDVHVFACALYGHGAGPRVPRRLAVVVDRRVVVDTHDQHARTVAARVAAASTGVLAEVAAGLRLLRSADQDGPPLRTTRLRGGAPPPRSWRDDPEGCQVLVATPDMWGSRLLFGGYGSSRRSWPREAGLLAYDSAVVVDEAHLSQQLVRTARRVAELSALVPRPLPIPVLQVVETTATQGSTSGRSVVGVRDVDLDADLALARRIRVPKPVKVVPVAGWPATDRTRAKVAAVVADEVVTAVERHGRTVGCVLNRVADAVAVAALLRERGLRVATLVGRLRPADVRELPAGLLTVEGSDQVDVLVATQTVEVGVDLDLTALVTDLAPGSALAQRAGRVNRLGGRESGPVTVLVPEGSVPAGVAPYQPEDLVAARSWLPGDGLASSVLRKDPPPSPAGRRMLLQRLERPDSWLLARTSDDLFAPIDLELWLSEDLEPDADLGLVVRDLPPDVADARLAVELLPPRDHEVFPLSRRTAVALVERWTDEDAGGLVLRVRDREVTGIDAEHRADLRAGDVLVVPSDRVVTRGGVVTDDPEDTASDVLETGVDRATPQATATLRIGAYGLGASSAALELARNQDRSRWTLSDRRELADVLAGLVVPEPILAAAVARSVELLRNARASEVAVVWLPDGLDAQATLVVLDQRRLVADEDLRQTWSCADLPVSLDQHQQRVGWLARAYAENLGLGAVLAHVLQQAGEHHDDGKIDDRFQRMLDRTDGALAKSGRRGRVEDERARAASGLPAGWRHEQLSVLLAWYAAAGEPERDLVVRLVGTTHGHGRVGFPHTAHGLLGAADPAAQELFDEGGWDQLVEDGDRRFGVWGTAYLEALLRAADGEVSRSGS